MRLAMTLLVLAAAASSTARAEENEADAAPAARVLVEPFFAAGEEVARADLHRIAEELFLTHLAATKKFVFVDKKSGSPDLVVTATIAHEPGGYRVALIASQRGAAPIAIEVGLEPSLEKLVIDAARQVEGLKKRSGYVVKREGDRIVIARGRRDGIAAGQRYRTTDTGEEFVIVEVAAETAIGRITKRAARKLSPGQVGAVDVIFVIDTTGSMQDEIDGVLANCSRFARRLADSGIDATLGLVTFRQGVEQRRAPTRNVSEVESWLRPIRAGGRAHETPFLAIEQALALPFRSEAKRVLILITDEPAFDALRETCPRLDSECTSRPQPALLSGDGLVPHVLARLEAARAVVFPVTIDDPQRLYHELGRRTGGTSYDLTRSQDFTRLLETLGEKIEGMFVEM